MVIIIIIIQGYIAQSLGIQQRYATIKWRPSFTKQRIVLFQSVIN